MRQGTLLYWDGDRWCPGGKMLLCRDTLVEGVSGQEGAEPPGRHHEAGREGGAGQVKN